MKLIRRGILHQAVAISRAKQRRFYKGMPQFWGGDGLSQVRRVRAMHRRPRSWGALRLCGRAPF